MFLNRRKTIYNNLNSLVKDKEVTSNILTDLDLLPTTRAEELDLKDFISLTNELLKLEVIKL